MTRSTNMEHVEVLRVLRDRWAGPDERVALDAAIASLSAQQHPAEAQADDWPYPPCEFKAPASDDGFQRAFYAIADMLGIPCPQPLSPKQVWEGQMRPKLQAMIGRQTTAPVVLARGWFHRRGPGDDYDLHDEASGAGKDCPECVPCAIISQESAPVGVEDLSCCGGNDEEPKSHCMDCSRYPGQLAQQPAACPKCGGTGEADSGGVMPWGAPAMILCECQQPAAVDGDWRKNAAEWLEAKAVEQEAANQKWPKHAACYKEWRDRPGILRHLAIQVLAAQQQGGAK